MSTVQTKESLRMETFLKLETTGLHKLKAWMSKDKTRSKAYLSREVGVSHTCIAFWLEAETRPEHLSRIIIQIITNDEVLVDDWLTLEEKEGIKKKVEMIELRKVG